jgi:hypothetical protein
MINRYAEWNLIKYSVFFSLISVAIYIIPFVILSFIEDGASKWYLPVEFPDFFVAYDS